MPRKRTLFDILLLRINKGLQLILKYRKSTFLVLKRLLHAHVQYVAIFLCLIAEILFVSTYTLFIVITKAYL